MFWFLDRRRCWIGIDGMATILIIDDEASVRSLLRTSLEGAGYVVVEAADGREGLARYQATPADLVLTDILMPGMNGFDLVLELTRTFLNVKVIAMSGAPEESVPLDTAKLLGARRTLRKPFTMDALLKAVRYELAH
jgi:two-component system response regulator (stage 0 sporulation protein F)